MVLNSEAKRATSFYCGRFSVLHERSLSNNPHISMCGRVLSKVRRPDCGTMTGPNRRQPSVPAGDPPYGGWNDMEHLQVVCRAHLRGRPRP